MHLPEGGGNRLGSVPMATRYAKRAELYRGLVVLASILIWLR